MALFGENKTAVLESQIENLQKENEYLRRQVETLQDALVSKIAPMAFAEQKAAEAAQEDPPNKEAIKQWQEEMEFGRRYAQSIEAPLFKDADDMIDKLTRLAGGPDPGNVSIHGNNES